MIHQQVLVGPHALAGDLVVPKAAHGLVVFAQCSGLSRHGQRNRFVAEVLQTRRLGTLLFDLLSEPESHDRANALDVGLLCNRLLQAMSWLRERRDLNGLRLGLLGSDAGAAAALLAAVERPHEVAAVVSRGGRPDLAGPALAQVRAPTLLLVGALDAEVLALNRAAARQLTCEKRLEVVPRATHLFEEAGALRRVVDSASEWLLHHLSTAGAR